jgi:TRAP-type C4-dicarboxylate transport system permease small subunit
MKLLRNWLEIIVGACLIVVVITTFLQVLFRFVLTIPSPWTEEVTRFAFAYMVFFGTALGVKYHNHLSVDVVGQFPVKLRNIIVTIGYLATIAFVCIFIYFGWIHSMNSRLQTTPTLDISLMYMYIIMPISGVLMLYYLVKAMITEISGKAKGEQTI